MMANGTVNLTTWAAKHLAFDNSTNYSRVGLTWFDGDLTAGAAVQVNDAPSTAWWHILRFNHSNTNAYYTDVAIPFNDSSMYYKIIRAGSVVNSEWTRILDRRNVSDNVYWANIPVGTSANTGTSPTFSTAYTSNWFRSTGQTGWFSENYGGGIWMTDNVWVRVYNGKGLHVDNTIEVAVNGIPSIRLQRSDAGEVSQYFINNTAGWAIGINPWGIGAGQFGIGQYSGTGSSTWRLRIDNNGYVYTSSYLNLGAGNENNASSPPRLWGLNGSDNFLRTYQTKYLRAGYLDGWDSNPNNSHPGYGARVFYSWNIGQAFNDSSGYSNGITIGSHPGDQAYGFQIVQNLWNDQTYTRRYNGGWQSWRTLMNCEDAQTVTNYKIFTSTGSNRATLYLRSAADVPNDLWMGSNGGDRWSITCRNSGESYFLGFYSSSNGWRLRLYHDGNNYCDGEWHVSGWVRFANWTGLYSPNNGAHFYPNNASSYGTWVMQGSRNGYAGIQLGASTAYMTVMDNSSDKGLYQEGQRWILYYNRSNGHLSFRDSYSVWDTTNNGSFFSTSTIGTWGLYECHANGAVAYFGCQNTSYVHFTNNAGRPYYFDNSVYVNGTLYWYSNATYYWNGNAGYSSTYYTNNWFRSYNATGWFNESYGGGIWMTDATYVRVYNGKYFIADRVYNAVWNDYAECRNVETIDPGRCVTETTFKKMILTTARLQPGCKLISDTYGTCIGETEIAKTPIAVSGRVLAYPYRNRYEYHLGDAVCSAPGGTIDIMTRDEIMMYPERIVGTVSEIPDYEIWQAGSKENPSPIQVNGRIWIYVR